MGTIVSTKDEQDGMKMKNTKNKVKHLEIRVMIAQIKHFFPAYLGGKFEEISLKVAQEEDISTEKRWKSIKVKT